MIYLSCFKHKFYALGTTTLLKVLNIIIFNCIRLQPFVYLNYTMLRIDIYIYTHIYTQKHIQLRWAIS